MKIAKPKQINGLNRAPVDARKMRDNLEHLKHPQLGKNLPNKKKKNVEC